MSETPSANHQHTVCGKLLQGSHRLLGMQGVEDMFNRYNGILTEAAQLEMAKLFILEVSRYCLIEPF